MSIESAESHGKFKQRGISWGLNKGRSKMFTSLLAIFLVSFLNLSSGNTAHAESTNLQRFEFTEKLENALQRVALQILRTKSGVRPDEITVTATIKLDDEAIAKEFLKEGKDNFASEADLERFTQRLKSTLASINDSNPQGTNAPGTNGDEAVDEVTMLIPKGSRMGALNLDVLAGETIRIADKSPKQSGANQPEQRSGPSVILALQLPQPTDPSNAKQTTERVDISAFILAINATLSIPSRFEPAATTEVKTATEKTIRNFLPSTSQAKVEVTITPSLPSLQDKAEERAAKLAEEGEKLAPVSFQEAPLQYLTENILDPKNPTLSGILNALFMLVGLVLASVAVIRASGKVASAISTSAAQISASGTSGASGDTRDDADDVVKIGSSHEQGAGGQAGLGQGRFDQAAEARALTSEMSRLRELFQEALKTDLLSLQEALGDLLRTDEGFAIAAQCASFVDHNTFNPITERLAPKLADDFRSFMLENSSLGSQTLSGADACRQLLAQWNLRRIEVRSMGSQPEIVQIREAMLVTEDNELFKWLESQAERESARIVFRNLTQNRMLQVLRQINPTASSTYAKSLDIVLGDIRLSANEALRALRDLKSREATDLSGRVALVRKILANLRIRDEEMVLNVLQGPDWNLRRLIATKAFLFADIGYLEPKFLLAILEKYKASEKTSVFYLLPTEVRNSLLGVYPEDSKSKEVLLLDLKVLESNRKRFSSILSARESILETFMSSVRNSLRDNPEQVANALRAQANALGWELPPDLEFQDTSSTNTRNTNTGTTSTPSSAA